MYSTVAVLLVRNLVCGTDDPPRVSPRPTTFFSHQYCALLFPPVLLLLANCIWTPEFRGADVFCAEYLFQQTVGFNIMAKAMWNGQLLAESDKFETVEGNIYFPEETVKREFLRPSTTTSSCPWKGQARYYSLLVDGQENPDAAWYYPDPKPAARNIKHHIAFWRGVEITKD
jgi:uncharacterized protein (DUF427 family)